MGMEVLSKKKRVCILSCVEMSRMTLASLYTDYFIDNGIEFDVICAKKKAENVCPGAREIIEFDALAAANKSIPGKVMHFWDMRRLVLDRFKKEHYDFIVVWNQVTAFLVADILARDFPGRYCINIRDYHYDRLPPIRLRLGKALKKAAFNTVSSEAFRKFLPKAEYMMIHSLNDSMLAGLEKTEADRGGPIRILNIGQIRWVENIYPLIDAMKNDDRYELWFVGTGSEQIDEYIKGKNINNVFTRGRFKPEQTVDFLKEADVIFNLYGVGNIHVDTALSIKLYYAVSLELPILTYNGTYINEVASKLGIGFSVNKNGFDGIADSFYDWYTALDRRAIHRGCEEYKKVISGSHAELRAALDKILTE